MEFNKPKTLRAKDFGLKKDENETLLQLKDKYLFCQEKLKLPIRVEFSFTFLINSKNNETNDLIPFWS